MKLGLGTVQFGLDYGVSNTRGKPSLKAVSGILSLARAAGIRVLDTAAQYGDAETVLGQTLPPASDFRIVSKTPAASNVQSDLVAAVSQAFVRSLERLRRPSLDALLVHHAEDMLGESGSRLWAALQDFKDKGLARKIGVSVYTSAEIDGVLARFKPDVVQIPMNVFDQRLIRSGHLKKLKDADVEVHCRSVFLQGLLLMEPQRLNGYFRPVAEHLAGFHRAVSQNGLTPLAAALRFVKGQPEIDVVLVGVAAEEELREILAAYDATAAENLDLRPFSFADEKILNPALWKLE